MRFSVSFHLHLRSSRAPTAQWAWRIDRYKVTTHSSCRYQPNYSVSPDVTLQTADKQHVKLGNQTYSYQSQIRHRRTMQTVKNDFNKKKPLMFKEYTNTNTHSSPQAQGTVSLHLSMQLLWEGFSGLQILWIKLSIKKNKIFSWSCIFSHA